MSQTNTNREKKIRSILERSSNIDVQTLQKYIDKKLTKEQLHEVEKQLLNSDFANDAVEGFANADFKVNIAASTNALNKEIKKYNKERGFYKIDYRVFYAAASVALIFVVLFGLFKLVDTNFSSSDLAMESKSEAAVNQSAITKNENLALNDEETISNETEKDLIEKLKSEQIEEVKANKNSNQSDAKIDNNLALSKDEARAEKDFSTSDIWVTKKEKVQTKNDEINTSNNLEGVAASPIVSANRQMGYDSSTTENIEQLEDDDYTIFSDSDKSKRAKMSENKKSPKEILFDAMQSYENKKYTEAILLFDSYLITNPNDEQGLYFGGMAYYENHNYKKTIPLLEKFLKQKSSITYQKNSQEAEWSLANSYLKTNQKQKAKTLLEKIANSNHTYSNQAKSLLKK